MNVDALSRGRHQPFYSVISLDGTQRCETPYSIFCPIPLIYSIDVAEENIKILNPTKAIIRSFFEKIPILPVHFEGVDISEEEEKPARGRMLLSPETRAMYPDDDALGSSWVTEGRLGC